MKRKELIGFILLGVVLISILFIGTSRVEKIENNEMTLVNQNQMDR